MTVQFKVPESGKLKHLEHVEIVSNIKYPFRGALEIALISPAGKVGVKNTIYQLLEISKIRLIFSRCIFLNNLCVGEYAAVTSVYLYKDP